MKLPPNIKQAVSTLPHSRDLHTVTMEIAKEQEIHAIFDEAIRTRKIDAVDKLLILFTIENPLTHPKEAAKMLRMSLAAVQNRLKKTASTRIREMIEGTFEEQAAQAREIGMRRMNDILHRGSNKDAIEAFKVLEASKAAADQSRAIAAGAGVTLGVLPTAEQARAILAADPANESTPVEIEPLPEEGDDHGT